MVDESLWTVQEVAKFLKVSPSWVYTNAEKLACRRVCGLIRFDPAVVRSFGRQDDKPRGRLLMLGGE